MYEEERVMARRIIKLAAAAIGGLFLLIAGCSSFQTVDTGHVGLKVRFGEIISDGLQPGFYFVPPFITDVVQMDTRVQKWDGKSEAYSGDVQQAAIQFSLNYNLDPAAVRTVYGTVGREWEARLIGQVVHEELKREFGQHDAVDIISARDVVARKMESNIRTILRTRNVIVTGFQLTNIDFSDLFEKAVEEKVVAQQEAIKAQNKTVQVKEEAIQRVETAKGDAESKVLTAEANAKATILNAEAEAKSIRVRAAALEANPKLVEWEAVKTWNGELPQYMLGGAVPFVNIKP